MQIFKNILVGVDLAQCQPLTTSGLTPIAREAIHRAVGLAKTNSAKLLFFSAANISEEILKPLGEEERTQVSQAVEVAGNKVLQDLVDAARKEGVDADRKIAPGKGWLGIIRQVLRGQHDLVVVGTRNLTGIRRMLFGNTAMKLMRRCPCPVLVTKIGTDRSPLNILVATDFKPAGDEAMRLGLDLARQSNANLHILHVVEYPLDRLWHTGLADAKQVEYHTKIRSEAEKNLNQHLSSADFKALGSRLHAHLADGQGIADVAIQHFIQVHHIHLLVMGTIGRGGIPGVMIGNTAERLLPEIHCSVLAVKPPDFHCPVKLEK